ncbi:MAG: nucleotidyltransferase [Elusimicrobia bacterium]|nr:nucleotidyltransferase [Elusimicrobiota bacterium]
MEFSRDYKDLFKTLNKYKVKYLVIGAYAAIFYTGPRYTKDLDIWIQNDPENAGKVYDALKKFGAPLTNVAVKDFLDKKTVYQIGVAPVRVDILNDLSGINFKKAWLNRTKTNYDGIPIGIISIDDLIRAKKRVKRPVDNADLERLLLAKRIKHKSR